MTTHDIRPAHERLDTFAVKHLVMVLKQLSGGSIGFDAYRDARTDTKEKLCNYIRMNWTAVQINEAHDAVRASYPQTNFRGRRGRRGRSSNPSTNVDPSTVADIPAPAPIPMQPVQPPSMPAPVSAPISQDTTNDLQSLASLLARIAASQLDESKVRAIVVPYITDTLVHLEKRLAELASTLSNSSSPQVMTHRIECPTLEPVNVGMQHSRFSSLLKACNARLRDGNRLNIWLAGPAGSGKTSAAAAVSKALSMSFYTNGALILGYQVTGFVDASGKYHTTAFRQAWEHGGVYLWDEVDGSAPNATIELNTALANGHMTFPDSPHPVQRHKDCIVIAGANTFGRGATGEYSGRAKQDEAFLSRFVPIEWPIDEAFERSLCADQSWVKRVQDCRSRVKAQGIRNHMITPRATVYGEALIAAGFSANETAEMVLRQGAPDDVWLKIKAYGHSHE